MIETIYQNPGITIFLIIWICGIFDYLIKKGESDLISAAVLYSFLYGIFKFVMWILR